MIIGITGTNGAGKGTVVEYLVQRHRFTHYSARDVWNEEINRRGLPRSRDNMILVANELHVQYGPDFFAQRAVEKANTNGGNAVIESIRSIGEAEYIRSHGGVLWAVDADVRTRYERVTKRQSETDKVSFDKFVLDEKTEWENQDPTKQNLKKVIAMADYTFSNNGTVEELYKEVENALKQGA